MRTSALAMSLAAALAACGDDLPSNLPPSGTPVTATTAEDTPLTVTVAAFDPEGDALTLAVASPPGEGTLTVNGLAVTYTPNANFFGMDTASLSVTDGTHVITVPVTITVTPVNDAPVAGADTVVAEPAVTTSFAFAVLLANDSDADDDTLTITEAAGATKGTVALTATGIDVTPPANFSGTMAFSYTLSDGFTTAPGQVTVTVGDNLAPTVIADSFSTDEDTDHVVTAATLVANDTDPEGQALTLVAVADAVNGTVSFDGTDVTFVPAPDFNGAASYNYTISDGVNQATGGVMLTVLPVNDAPMAINDAAATPEDVALALVAADLLSNDVDIDGDNLTLTEISSSVNGTVSLSGGDITFVPAADFVGTASFVYTVSDGSATDEGTVLIDVGGANDAPVAVDDSATTAEDTALVLMGSALASNDTDADSDPLTVTAVSGASNGTVSLAAGVVTFTPADDFVGTAGFDYTVSDGLATDLGHVTVTVTAVNDAPVAVDDVVTTSQDTAVDVNDSELLSDDTDIDGPALTVTAVQAPINGTVSRVGGVTTFTPAAGFTGNASFEYVVSDGSLTDIGLVRVSVGNVNDAPVAVDDTATIDEDTALMVTATTLVGNDTDLDNDPLSVTAVSNPVNGTVGLAAGVITFTPGADFFGTAGFDYTVSDGVLTDTGHVTVTVTSVDDLPEASDDGVTVDEDSSTTLTVLGNDLGLGDGGLVVTITTPAGNGTATANGNGTVTYAPTAEFSGDDSFAYTVTDADGDSSTATVSISVTGVNDAPIADAGTGTTAEDAPVVLTLTGSDVDSPSLTFAVATGPMFGTLGAITQVTATSASVTYTPPLNYAGDDAFTFTVNDGALTSAAALISLTITDVIECGDGVVEGTELCDDTNLVDGDGCDAACVPELGWTCLGAPSVCETTCGDTIAAGDEQCDDGDAIETNGCTTQCVAGRVCDASIYPGQAFDTDPATGHCYMRVSLTQDWTTAELNCEAAGGYLAVVTSGEEQTRVHDLLDPAEPFAFIGLSLIAGGVQDNPNDYVWVNGEAQLFSAWAPGQPDALAPSDTCVALGNALQAWDNIACLGAIPFVCEFAPVACGDGLTQTFYGEACDDGNSTGGDGCSALCEIEAGAQCQPGTPATCGKLVINEVDYDQPGTDTTEFVEIYNAGSGPFDVTGTFLVLMNGTGPAEYFFDGSSGPANVSKRLNLLNAVGLTGTSLMPGDYLVVGGAAIIATVPVGVASLTIVPAGTGFIQNGATDAVALYQPGIGMVDALSYEGNVANATPIGEASPVAFTEATGASADTGSVAQESIARVPNGLDTNDNAADFEVRVSTPGAAN